MKSITIVWGDVLASQLDAWVQSDDLCKLMRVTWTVSTSTEQGNDQFPYRGGSRTDFGSWVLEEGELLGHQTTGLTYVDVQANGYLLDMQA